MKINIMHQRFWMIKHLPASLRLGKEDFNINYLIPSGQKDWDQDLSKRNTVSLIRLMMKRGRSAESVLLELSLAPLSHSLGSPKRGVTCQRWLRALRKSKERRG